MHQSISAPNTADQIRAIICPADIFLFCLTENLLLLLGSLQMHNLPSLAELKRKCCDKLDVLRVFSFLIRPSSFGFDG